MLLWYFRKILNI